MPNETAEIIYNQPMEKVDKGDWDLMKSLGTNKAWFGALAGAAVTAGAAALLGAVRNKGAGIDNIASVISQVVSTGNIAPAIAAFAHGGGHGGSGVNMQLLQENTLLKSEKYTDGTAMMLDRRICALETQGAVNANDDAWFRRYSNAEFVHQPKVCMNGGFIPYQPNCCCCNTGEGGGTTGG